MRTSHYRMSGYDRSKLTFSLVLCQAQSACSTIIPNESQDTPDHTCVPCFQVLLRAGWSQCVVDPFGGEEKAGRIGNVCFTQGVGECVVDRARERMGIQDGRFWRDDREF